MRIVSFNINGIRARPHQLSAVIESHSPEVIGLQETKVADEEFPEVDPNYHWEIFGQKGHYGVAIASRQKPQRVIKGFPWESQDAQRRFIACEYAGFWILNGYFPQGESRDHPEKFPNKQLFYSGVRRFLDEQLPTHAVVFLLGDLNVSPLDIDIGIGDDSRKRWLKTGKCSFLPEEREWYAELTNWGLADTYRHLHPDDDSRFSWFDYRSFGFEREPKRGLRIDHILISVRAAGRCRSAGIDYDIRAMTKPSDHCPVWVDYDHVEPNLIA